MRSDIQHTPRAELVVDHWTPVIARPGIPKTLARVGVSQELGLGRSHSAGEA